jgi:hypothetical protein
MWWNGEGTAQCWSGTFAENLFYNWSWGRLTGGPGDDWTIGEWHKSVLGQTPGTCWQGPAPTTGVAVVDRPENLAAFTAHDAGCTTGNIFHIPHADGVVTPPLGHRYRDHDDAYRMRTQLCHALNETCHEACYGGTCSPGTSPGTISCDGLSE